MRSNKFQRKDMEGVYMNEVEAFNVPNLADYCTVDAVRAVTTQDKFSPCPVEMYGARQ